MPDRQVAKVAGQPRLEGDQPRNKVPLSRRFTVRYAFAILIMAVFALAARATVDSTLHRVEDANARLAVAAEQPTRVHRIVETGRRLDDAGAVGDLRSMQQASNQLDQEAAALRQTQAALIQGDDELGALGQDLDPQLLELELGSGRLDQRLSTFAGHADVLAGFAGPNDGPNRAPQLAELIAAEEGLTTDLGVAIRLYGDDITAALAQQRDTNTLLLVLCAGIATAMVFVLFRPMARSIHSETTQLEAAERNHRENNLRQTFRTELSKALDVCEDEDEVLATAGRALVQAVPDHPSELLLVDDQRSHLFLGVANESAGAAGCPVDAPKGCAALRAGQAMTYESSRMLNVCPKLPLHDGPPCSAICIPLVFNGEALGVLHAIGPENQLFDATTRERLKVLAEESGDRLGTLRITQATERLAARDVLTDLENRRTLLDRSATLIHDGRPFSLAVADLDHFKDLNDTYGHETGDRALQLFAATLRKQLRPEDIVARYGGEEFVVVLPDTTIRAAATTIERLQQALLDDVHERNSVPFTASWGLTDSTSGMTFQEMLNAADILMYEAKRAGRNCLVVDGEAASRAEVDITEAGAGDPTAPQPAPELDEPVDGLSSTPPWFRPDTGPDARP